MVSFRKRLQLEGDLDTAFELVFAQYKQELLEDGGEEKVLVFGFWGIEIQVLSAKVSLC